MSRVAVPADKRFRRARVRPRRPRRNWRGPAARTIRLVAIAAVLLFGVYRARDLAAQAHVLRIERIVVQGNEHLSTGEVLAVLGGMRGQSLIWSDLNGWRQRLLTSPWVRDADLRRSLPSTVEVVVSERRPIGIGRIAGQMYLVDERGAIIDEFGPQYTQFDLPIIDGLTGSNDDGTMTDRVRADLAARVIGALQAKPEIARRLSQVDVQDSHNASVILTGDGAALRLGDQQFLPRLQSYLELAPTLRDRVSDIDYVDLRFDGRIYVRPVDAGADRPAARVAPPAPRRPGPAAKTRAGAGRRTRR
ncbi:MAG: FtsQ-type POTRA domain-containing protein [Acidobacteriota bacterium]